MQTSEAVYLNKELVDEILRFVTLMRFVDLEGLSEEELLESERNISLEATKIYNQLKENSAIPA